MKRIFLLLFCAALAAASADAAGRYEQYVRTATPVARGITRLAWTIDGVQPSRVFAMKFNLRKVKARPGLILEPTDDNLTVRHTVPEFAGMYRARGETPLAGVNGDFFGMETGKLSGLAITEGKLRGVGYAVAKELSGEVPHRYVLMTVDGEVAIDFLERDPSLSPKVMPVSADEFTYRGKKIWMACCAYSTAIKDGKACDVDPRDGTSSNPLTFIGFGRNMMILLVADGRQENWSVGAEKEDLVKILLAEGVVDAAEMDGGGSTTLWASDAAGNGVINRPSDGSLRKVAEGFFALAGTEKMPVWILDEERHVIDTAIDDQQVFAADVPSDGNVVNLDLKVDFGMPSDALPPLADDDQVGFTVTSEGAFLATPNGWTPVDVGTPSLTTEHDLRFVLDYGTRTYRAFLDGQLLATAGGTSVFALRGNRTSAIGYGLAGDLSVNYALGEDIDTRAPEIPGAMLMIR